ncbi:2-dehydro-3-deoxygalactonokinase [Marilutibacter alkalisoli]|uniref:2-dehydro-3-deoxygalactonokinase n=1 Tax=Marilutibacter alkalisoli TaxID=2591633 RepID=A0A514BV20_9GAMM|nr:2-dehydro-3-deoxygalactonokinase [Lysobacter alkalisoli]QDH71253.1 2-dehydro-3-deoxygalactonokinase [Lysobacter alkalisoli]
MIAVDWGTSSLRLYRLDESGLVRERRRSDCGAMASTGRFGDVLAQETAGWNDTRILMCGMVGGRGGWREVPYLDCPAGNAELAQGMQRIEAAGFEGRELWIVPGLCDTVSDTVPDVMRGEEAQLAALLDVLPGGAHLVCLPGTHSKWVTVHDGLIRRIATAMTGEVYAILRQHSILGQSMPSAEVRFDAYAFDAGLKRSAQPDGLLHHLFGVRTSRLFRLFDEAALPSYLSGILIGHEIRASGLFSQSPRPVQVHLIGNERLLSSYAHALTALGIGVQRHPEELAARGLHALWARRVEAGTAA